MVGGSVREIRRPRDLVGLGADTGCVKRFDLARHYETSVGQRRVDEWLHSKAIAYDDECLLLGVPEREREHANQAIEARFAPPRPRCNDNFGVAVRVEWIAMQLDAKLFVVVDLAVEHDDVTAVAAKHRLATRVREIDDAETPMPHGESVTTPDTLSIGPAMAEPRAHRFDEVCRIETGSDYDSAHQCAILATNSSARTQSSRVSMFTQLAGSTSWPTTRRPYKLLPSRRTSRRTT